MKRIILTLIFLVPLAAAAQIYKTTDADGNVVYTDKPPAGDDSSERIELTPTNTSAPPPEIERPDAPLDLAAEAEAAPVTYSVEIVSPETETTIPMGPGNFSLNARVDPGLKGEEKVQLSVDGSPWGEPQSSTTWQLTNVYRGAHDLTVSVLDASGDTLASSTPVRVYVLRPSINFKNRK